MNKNYFVLIIILLGVLVVYESCKKEEFGSIYGLITDKATGEPVKNANVQLRPSGETSLTGDDGRYEFLELKHGDYSITVSKTGYTDLIDDYVIIVNSEKAMRRDVQIEKLPAALKILDDEGNEMLVYYSLGNYVNSTASEEPDIGERMLGAMAEITVIKDDKGEVIIDSYAAHPLVTYVSGNKKTISVFPMDMFNDNLAQKSFTQKLDTDFGKSYLEEIWESVMNNTQ